MQYCVLVDYGYQNDCRWEFLPSPAAVVLLSTARVRFDDEDRRAMLMAMEQMTLGDVALFAGRGVDFTIICCKGD